MKKLPILAAIGHALRSTRNNLPFAWHVSWPWLAILFPLNLLIETYLPQFNPEAADPQAVARNAEASLGFLFYAVVSMLAFSSIAVSWHRYILQDEVPQGLARLRLDDDVWRYFGNTLLIGLTVALAVLPVTIVLSLISTLLGLDSNGATALTVAATALVVIPLMYRLMVKLPAIAVGNTSINLSAALQVTRGNSLQLCVSGVIILVSALLVGLGLGAVYGLLAGDLGGPGHIVAALAQQIVSWVITIFSVTFLTSLYGFFVEGREF
jgi:hypothetical protein